jgi:hypothetical protein
MQEIVIPLAEQESKISLRDVEKFVKSGCSDDIPLVIRRGNQTIEWTVKQAFSAVGLKKRRFDMFRRFTRIYVNCGTDKPFETTLGQLLFIQWALVFGILKLLFSHADEFERRVAQESVLRSSLSKTLSSDDNDSSSCSSLSTTPKKHRVSKITLRPLKRKTTPIVANKK